MDAFNPQGWKAFSSPKFGVDLSVFVCKKASHTKFF